MVILNAFIVNVYPLAKSKEHPNRRLSGLDGPEPVCLALALSGGVGQLAGDGVCN